MIMNTRDALSLKHAIPINKAAAMVFCKSPEWLESVTRVKLMVAKVVGKVAIHVHYFSRPPATAEHEMCIPDRRGLRVIGVRKNGYGEARNGVITGYADGKKVTQRVHTGRARKRIPGWVGDWDENRAVKTDSSTIHKWWVLYEDGEFVSHKWCSLRKYTKLAEDKK